MMFIDSVAPPEDTGFETAVEVGVWEGHLLRNKTHAGKALCTYSLDNGPLSEEAEGILVFRFTGYDWNRNVRALLESNNIHYSLIRELQVNPSQHLLKKRIFIAEDDADILFHLTSMFQDAGYQVTASRCGKPVVEGNFSWIDLFILGRKMPDLDGLDICRFIRSRADTRDTPVIMISATPACGKEALTAGATDYLQKPFPLHYLLNVARRYLRKS